MIRNQPRLINLIHIELHTLVQRLGELDVRVNTEAAIGHIQAKGCPTFSRLSHEPPHLDLKTSNAVYVSWAALRIDIWTWGVEVRVIRW